MRFSVTRVITVSEMGFGALITLFLVVLHFQFCLNAGALWRDEIATLHVATAPTLGEMWRLLAFENHPVLHYLIVRSWCFLGFGATDPGLRTLCLVIGLWLIAALWISGFIFNKSAPLLPLAFFGLNENTLREEALRPYGLMLVWLVLAFAYTARLTFQPRPSRRTVLLALIFSVLSVQTDFLSVPALTAIWTGSIVVLLFRKSGQEIVSILMIGAISAVSVLPYVPMAIQAHGWNQLQVVARSANYLKGAFYWFYWLGAGENWLVCGVFLILLALFLAIAVVPALRGGLSDSTPNPGGHVLFSFLVCAAAVLGTVLFLSFIGFPPARRYYSPAIGVIALSLAVPVRTFRDFYPIRIVVIAATILVACAFAGPIIRQSKTRYTNCDSAAAAVSKSAEPGDIIVLTRFDYGVSFERYYRGAAAWQTLPPINDYSVFRWDLVKQKMTEAAPIGELLTSVETALRSGHRLFVVGPFTSIPTEPPVPIAPAPTTTHGWSLYAYLANWKDQLAFLISRHALEGGKLPLAGGENIDPIEKLNVSVISGWH